MSTNQQKRYTKQVRIQIDLHSAVKMQAVLKQITISKLFDQILGDYLKLIQTEPKP